ncbi:MAG: thiamine pyrophosphate-dependent enzyme [Sulfolobales archaeon]|nr:thiamine pyrophosphate-dependent enzyme [Sulfolobales archaeon]MDW8010221.1 thiamine pyrophosphate-dependent enzyme [Sulfolobales archaeon]
MAVTHPLDRYLRVDRIPTMWCPGCGLGIALGAMLRAIDRRIEEGVLKRENVGFVGGIGCTARMTLYPQFDSAHVIHGRAIPFALAVKIVKPEMKMIVVGGDGDIAAIGGNHLLHALKRNADLLVIMVNNMIYGMTGGQLAPTTPRGLYTTTTPYGNPEKELNVIKLAAALGANYVARSSITHPQLLERTIYKALAKRGLAFVEVLSTCPEIFGRHIGFRNPVDLYMELRKRIVVKTNPSIEESDYDWSRGFVIGEFVDKDEPGFLDTYREYVLKAVGGAER